VKETTMEIRIRINDRLVRFARGLFSRKVLPFLLAVVLLGGTVTLLADPFVIPFVFSTGEVISSSQMNTNFEQVGERINSVQTQVVAVETQVDSLVASGGSLWSANAPHIYYDGGNVGIGTMTPATALEVDGIITAPLMMSRVVDVVVSNGTGTFDTSVSTSTYEAFIGGISDQTNVSHARHRYWVYASGGSWEVYVNYENSANVSVNVRLLFIRKELFDGDVQSEPPY